MLLIFNMHGTNESAINLDIIARFKVCNFQIVITQNKYIYI